MKNRPYTFAKGDKFGELTVFGIGRYGVVHLQCSCGNLMTTGGRSLINGRRTDCGHVERERRERIRQARSAERALLGLAPHGRRVKLATTIYLREDQHQRLSSIAATTTSTVAEIIRASIDEHLARIAP